MPICIFCDQENSAGIANCRLCGAPLPPSENEVLREEVFRTELQRLVNSGQHVQAVAAYRRWTGVDLEAAKQAIDALEQDHEFDDTAHDAALERQVILCLERNNKIEAIRLYRERTGTGLKEAKDAVEAIAVRVGLGPAPGTGGGCLGLALTLCVLLAIVIQRFAG